MARCTVILVFVAALAMPLLAAPAAAEALYREDFEPPRPPEEMFGGGLLRGEDGAWAGAVEDGAYLLENREDANAVKYHYLEAAAGADFREADLSVSVAAREPEGTFGLGLLYRYDRQSRTYLVFAVTTGAYMIFGRHQEGVRPIAAGAVEGLELTQPTRLQLEADGALLHFLVGGRRVASVDNELEGGAGVGIIAFGRGRFRFDDFELSVEEPEAPAAPR